MSRLFFFFKQKTAYEMRISDWSSDVCSSDLEYGIRIENLVLVEKRELSGAEREMMGFETLTFAPIDRHLVDVAMLVQDERDWLNSYHARVLEIVGPQLAGEAKTWLEAACAPL